MKLKLTGLEKIGLVIILAFLIFSRFFQLKLIPGSLTHDETVYAAQSASYALTGTGLDGDHRPWELNPVHPLYAELPATVIWPGFVLFKNAQLATHFSSALMGVLLPFIFGWLLWGIWKNKTLSYLGVVVAAISPLWWQFSRLSYDTFFSVFFYFLGGALLVNLKNKQKLFSLIPLTLGFFQYQGLKPLLIPWVMMLVGLSLATEKKLKIKKLLAQPSMWVLAASFALTLIYGLVLLPHQQTDNRLSSNIITDTASFQTQVDQERRLSLISPLNKFASNKITTRLDFMVRRFWGSYNPFLLFLEGESNTTGFILWTHGVFYLADGFLIILGVIALMGDKNRKVGGWILAAGLIIFCLPNLINTMSQWHMMRTFLSYSTLLFFITWGAWLLWQHRLTKWLLIGIYALSLANFSYQYFYRYPVTNLDAATFDEKLAAHYAQLASQQTDQPVTIYTEFADMFFLNYLVYEEQFTPENIDLIKQTYQENVDLPIKHYQLGQVTITNDCVDINVNQVFIWKTGHSFCQTNPEKNELSEAQQEFISQRLTIPAVLDSGEAYRLHSDVVCSDLKLNSFAHLVQLKQLDLMNLTREEFCQNWITDLRDFN